MIIYFNKPLVFSGKGDVWIADNEEKKLIIANKTNFKGISNWLKGKPFFKSKEKVSYIFLEEEDEDNKEIRGIFINKDYGYRCLNKDLKVFEDFCTIGNTVFKFGIYKLGTIILEHNVKKNYGDFLWELTWNGWINKGLFSFEETKKILTDRSLREENFYEKE